MKLICIKYDNANKLYEYWNKIGDSIPYFYTTSYESFIFSLFEDTYNGIKILEENYIYVAVEDNVILGFIQYGIPGFHFENWEMIKNPQIGVVRNIFFEKTRSDIGQKLLELANQYFQENGIKELYAFYHAMGMSCNGNHGKLYERYEYIGDLLVNGGFQVEHENVYYTKTMLEKKINKNIEIDVLDEANNKQMIEVHEGGNRIGSAEVKFIDHLTGMKQDKILYLAWIGIEENLKGKGIGSKFLNQIINYYIKRGYTEIHTDTALNNIVAQEFYERNGFINKGLTRSYMRK